MKKILKISIISWLIFSWSLVAYQLSAAPEDILTWYKLYEDRNKKVCTKSYKPDNKIFNSESKYEDFDEKEIFSDKKTWDNHSVSWNDLDVAKETYKDTMNSVYKCALLNAQERSIKFIMETLWEDKESWPLSKQYKDKLKRLESIRTVNKCLDTHKTNQQLDKHNVLKQATFELCKYNNYLEYLVEYNSVIANVLEQDKKTSSNNLANSEDDSLLMETYNITMIANLEKQKKSDIKEEIEKAYKLHPIAFQAYSEYENNLPIHDLLTLLRNDFIEYRIDLHNNLNPISQLVYKISNAMKE